MVIVSPSIPGGNVEGEWPKSVGWPPPGWGFLVKICDGSLGGGLVLGKIHFGRFFRINSMAVYAELNFQVRRVDVFFLVEGLKKVSSPFPYTSHTTPMSKHARWAPTIVINEGILDSQHHVGLGLHRYFESRESQEDG